MISWTLCRQRLYRLRIPLQPIAFRCDVMSRVPKSSIYKISAAHLHMCFPSKSYLASKGTKGDEGRNKMLMWWFLYVCETSDGCSWCWRLQCGTFVAKQAGEFRTTFSFISYPSKKTGQPFWMRVFTFKIPGN